MNFYKTLSNRRINQFNIEENLDHGLNSVFHECPSDIFSYIMLHRNINRKLSIKLSDSSFLNFFNQYSKYMDTVDKIQTFKTNEPTCQEIKEKIKLMYTLD